MESGVYLIEHKSTGRKYIGSAVNIEKRWKQHRRQAENGKHHSRFFQRTWSKHGADSFAFKTLLLCDKKNLLMYEQAALDRYAPELNTLSVAGSVLGYRHTEEAKKRMSEAAARNKNFTGHQHSEESRLRISQSRKGKGGGPRSPERLAKISAALKGRSIPKEVREKISESLKGKTQSLETIAKRVAKLKGRKMPPGFGESVTRRMLGVKKSPEHVQKMREAKASLSAQQVREIRRMAADGVRHKDIAVKFGITVNNVSIIKTRHTYGWVD